MDQFLRVAKQAIDKINGLTGVNSATTQQIPNLSPSTQTVSASSPASTSDRVSLSRGAQEALTTAPTPGAQDINQYIVNLLQEVAEGRVQSSVISKGANPARHVGHDASDTIRDIALPTIPRMTQVQQGLTGKTVKLAAA